MTTLRTRGASVGHLDSDGSETEAWVVTGSAAFLDAAGYGAPLARGLGVTARGLRCSAPEQADLPPVS